MLTAGMKTPLIVALLILWSSVAAAQTPISRPKPDDESVRDQIRAARARDKAEERADQSKRPWDRDSAGKRPWDAPAPSDNRH